MADDRRALVQGATDVFTITLRDRRKGWLITHAERLRSVVRDVRGLRPFAIAAIVVLPDHSHPVWTLPAGDADFPGRRRAIKAGFTPALTRQGVAVVRDSPGAAIGSRVALVSASASKPTAVGRNHRR
jgi:putative transposase